MSPSGTGFASSVASTCCAEAPLIGASSERQDATAIRAALNVRRVVDNAQASGVQAHLDLIGEFLERPRAHQAPAVDEEGRRGFHLELRIGVIAALLQAGEQALVG